MNKKALQLFYAFPRQTLIADILSYACIIAFTAGGILVSLNRFWQYEVFYYDFGIFDQAIWAVSRFRPPLIDHLVVGGKWIFADHFNPSIFVLSPIYWVTDRSESILIAQTLLVGFSALILYRIGIRVLKNSFLSFSVLFCYLLFIGLQNAIISDFHEVTASVPFLMLLFWSAVSGKKKLYWVSLFLFLGFKESNMFVASGLGIAVYMLRKEWRRIGALTVVFSLLWGLAAIKLIIPYFSGGIYQYFTFPGKEEASLFTWIFDNPIKRRTLFYSFLSFGFLPVLSPPFWFLILQDFFVRFFPNAPTRWDLGLHYSAQLASIMSVSSIFGIHTLKKMRLVRDYMHLIGFVLICNSFIVYRFILHGPLGLAYNSVFYDHTKQFSFLDSMMEKVPADVSVMAQNNLAVRFTHQKVLTLRDDYYIFEPDYIVLDLRSGQNPNNFFPTQNPVRILKKLQHDERYVLTYTVNDQYVFKRTRGKGFSL